MAKKRHILFFFFFINLINAQDITIVKKQLNATETTEQIKIDGMMNEQVWQSAANASDFIQLEPKPEIAAEETSLIKVLFDNSAIYIFATLEDKDPSQILKALSERDEFGNTDWFGIAIDAYKDGLNGVGFFVSAAGVQYDLKYSGGGGSVFSGDENWDAVWKSEVKMTDKGWQVEMKIPYAAIRFPRVEMQQWHINFGRSKRKTREQSWWNEIKPDIDGFLTQAGILNGIHDIKSPVRLSATPFFSTYFENYYDKNADQKSSWGRSFNGGMDIKYGINDAFTLDMTLIPDFGQVQSDNEILNLSPFEVQFDEQRQFFTEGTELFDKGDIFYSRRIGSRPLFAGDVEDQLLDGEEILNNPSTTQLFNATKISGRTQKGLGVGFFNAVSGASYATIKNEENVEREIETNPLTNYNVLVFDQNLKNNSYLSLINTNVWRNGSAYEANVTATEFALKNKKNSYEFAGQGALSQKYFTDDTDLGHRYELGFGKTSGNFNWEINYEEVGDDFDQNDLGFLNINNTRSFSLDVDYNIFKPFWRLNRASVFASIWNTNLYHQPEELNRNNAFSDFGIFIGTFALAKSFFASGLRIRLEPIVTYDYFEPRTFDFTHYYTYPTNYFIGGFTSTDYRKKFAYDLSFGFRKWNEEGRYLFEYQISPRFRASDKLFFVFRYNNRIISNGVGFVSTDDSSLGYDALKEDEIIFGRRDRITINNILDASYIFNNRMGLTFRARHYWTKVKYNSFHLLDEKGILQQTSYKGKDIGLNDLHNSRVNIFNIDMVYKWRFAPGSDLIVVWKNSLFSNNEDIEPNYFQNFNDFFDAPQRNSFSLKLIYFLDYLNLIKKRK